MNLIEIKELIMAIENTSLKYIKIEKNDFKLEVSKNNDYQCNTMEEHSQSLDSLYRPTSVDIIDEDVTLDFSFVVAPLMGTYYSSPNPNDDSFIRVGDIIKQGDTLCILEAMKLMNEITSDVDGEVVEILVQNEDLVEYNQPLIKIKPL